MVLVLYYTPAGIDIAVSGIVLLLRENTSHDSSGSPFRNGSTASVLRLRSRCDHLPRTAEASHAALSSETQQQAVELRTASPRHALPSPSGRV